MQTGRKRNSAGWVELLAETGRARPPRAVLVSLGVAVAYYVGARIGFALTAAPTPVSTLWPPNAILLAALLLSPLRWWPGILLAAFPAHLAVELGSGVPLSMVLSWFVSNSAEALIGAAAVRRFTDRPAQFDSFRQVTVFVVFAAILAPFLSSFLDAAFVQWNGWGADSYWHVWSARFFSNVLAILTLVPAIATWADRDIGSLRSVSPRRLTEAIVLVGGLLLVCTLVFARPALRCARARSCCTRHCRFSCGRPFDLGRAAQARPCSCLRSCPFGGRFRAAARSLADRRATTCCRSSFS